MAFQDFIRWILPREDVFYGLLERQGALLVEAARTLSRFSEGEPAERLRDAIQEIEHRADALVYEIEEQLAKVFVTPIDREDIQHLAAAIDDVIDLINLTARTIALFGVPSATPPMQALIATLVRAAEVIDAELPALRRHEYSKLIAAGRTIKEHEKEGDRIFRAAVGELFADPAIDAKVLLRDKEVLEDLENAIDKCETVAERLKNLAVKHG
ncbi:MAG: DUF47 family protein [Nannocystaceae bacterium]